MHIERKYDIIKEEDSVSNKYRKCLIVKCYEDEEKIAQDVLLKTYWIDPEMEKHYPYSFMIDSIYFAKDGLIFHEEE